MVILRLLSILSLFLLCYPAYSRAGDFKDKLYNLKWVAYAPTDFNPGINDYPAEESIRQDLQLLLKSGFNGLITYGSERSLKDVPYIAKEMGFKAVIMGIWDIDSEAEMQNAIAAKDYADAYCLGNEGLNIRYGLEHLKERIGYIKGITGKPATTTEQIEDYSIKDVVDIGDWVFPNAHPFFHHVTDPLKASKWIAHYYKIVKRSAGSKPVLFKECGFPTAGCRGCNEAGQKDFFIYLGQTDVKFVYFEAFDQYWKNHFSVEPHWGMFDKRRRPKAYIKSKL